MDLWQDTAFLAQTSAILFAMGGAVLFYRSFRENYLFLWLAGWIACFIRNVLLNSPSSTRWSPALGAAFFVVAVLCFTATIFLYTQNLKRLKQLLPLAAIAALLAFGREFWRVESLLLNALVHASYVGLTASAAWEIVRFNRGRAEPGPWLLASMLLALHLDRGYAVTHVQLGLDLMIDVVLGIGMTLLVLDDTQLQSRRLRVLNNITTAIAQAQKMEVLMVNSLEELRRLMGARASWIRLLDEGSMELAGAVGLSDAYVAQRAVVPVAGSISEGVVRNNQPTLLRLSGAHPGEQPLRAEGFEFVCVIPVRGRSAVIGTMLLAFDRPRFTTPDEKRFLATTANQLGLAAENLQLVAKIRRSRTRWVRMFDSLPDPMFLHDPSFRVIKANDALLRRIGLDYHQAYARTCSEVLPGKHRGWKDCPYCEAPSGSDFADPCFGGFSLVSTSKLDEGDQQEPGVVHVIHDVTAHRKSEERYQLLFEQMHEAVFISTPSGQLLDCNEALVRLLGYASKEELLKVPTAQHFENPAEREVVTQLLQESGFLRNYEMRLKRRDGTPIIALESSYGSLDAEGKVERFQGFLLDVTARKHAEQELRIRNRELFTLNAIASASSHSFELDTILNAGIKHLVSLFEVDTGMVCLFDETRCVMQRRAALGYITEVGRNTTEFEVAVPLLNRLRQDRAEVLTSAHMAAMPKQMTDFVAAEQIASFLWVVLWAQDRLIGVAGVGSRSGRVFSQADQSLMLAVARQLAGSIERIHLYNETRKAYEDLRKAQEQLLQSEKMSAIGQLISGVAHELNNPLTAILGYAQLLEAEVLNERERDYVSKLYKQAQRTHKIVQNLLSFARQRKPEKHLVDITKVLEDTVALRDYDMRLNDIDLLMDLEPGLPQVIADAHQLEQVFLNILNNAVDAILERGQRGGCLRVSLFADHGIVAARIHDSGPGIRDVKRIFDPFYTTKAVGKGTGLGLSICYGIVKEHGGDIVASNHPSGGAIFEIRLPAAETIAIPAASPATLSRPALKGRILVVDDEESVLDFESRVLAGAGAEVVCAATGNEAIALLKSETFDLVVVDGKMPGGWTGPEIYRWLEEHNPGLAQSLLLTHSHLEDANISRFIEESGIQSIAKPFSVADLVLLVHGMLNRSKAAVQS